MTIRGLALIFGSEAATDLSKVEGPRMGVKDRDYPFTMRPPKFGPCELSLLFGSNSRSEVARRIHRLALSEREIASGQSSQHNDRGQPPDNLLAARLGTPSEFVPNKTVVIEVTAGEIRLIGVFAPAGAMIRPALRAGERFLRDVFAADRANLWRGWMCWLFRSHQRSRRARFSSSHFFARR